MLFGDESPKFGNKILGRVAGEEEQNLLDQVLDGNLLGAILLHGGVELLGGRLA